MENQCSNEVNNSKPNGCYDYDFSFVAGGLNKSIFINPETEMFVRLCHKGLYPIPVTVTGGVATGERLIYFKDINGKIVGSSVNNFGYEVREAKPNSKLTKEERKLLKEYNLL